MDSYKVELLFETSLKVEQRWFAEVGFSWSVHLHGHFKGKIPEKKVLKY